MPHTQGHSTPLVYDDVRSMALALPGVEDSTSYGTPSLKVRGKMLTRLWEDGETMVLKVPFMVRDHLMRSQPDVFFTTPHYHGYPSVLVRLSKVDPDLLRNLLEDAWRQAATKKAVADFDGSQK